MDVALLADESSDTHYLLPVAAPEDSWLCPTLLKVDAASLESSPLRRHPDQYLERTPSRS